MILLEYPLQTPTRSHAFARRNLGFRKLVTCVNCKHNSYESDLDDLGKLFFFCFTQALAQFGCEVIVWAPIIAIQVCLITYL